MDDDQPSREQLKARVESLETELRRIKDQRLSDVVELEKFRDQMEHGSELAYLRREADHAEAYRLHLQQIYGSWAYRIGRRLGLAPEPFKDDS